MERYRIEVGNNHGVSPANIVGAIAGEADIDSDYIGRIAIFNEYSTVDLPYGMPRHILKILQKARIYERRMQMKREQPTNTAAANPKEKDRRKKPKKRPLTPSKHKSSESNQRKSRSANNSNIFDALP